MVLNPQFFPWMTGGIIAVSLIICWRGWQTGFIHRLLDLLTLVLSIFLSWPLARAAAGVFVLFTIDTLQPWQNFFVNELAWFVLIAIGLKIVFSLLYMLAKVFTKVKIIGTFDHAMGLVLSIFMVYILLCLLTLFLDLPFVQNGALYVESSFLRYIQQSIPVWVDMLSQGDIQFDALRSLLPA